MTECPFCQIQSEPERIIKRAELTTVFLSNPRLMEGHTLVVPNRHIEEPWQLTEAELKEIFQCIFDIEKHLLLADVGAGFDIRQNYRPFLQQSQLKIDHVHFHILPRYKEDKLHTESMHYEVELFEPLPEAEATKIKNILEVL
jgi:histidine triad (HIT) family protein